MGRFCLKHCYLLLRVHIIKRICQPIYQTVKGLKDVLNMLHEKKSCYALCYALPLNRIPSALDVVKQLV